MTDWTAFDRQLASRGRAIVQGLVEFVRFNSVSQESAGVHVTGEWLAAALRAGRPSCSPISACLR